MADIRLGIIGTGRIARRFVPECNEVNGITVTAVYNPHATSADKFAGEFRINSYSDIDEFLNNIDAVYIAAPHEKHVPYIRLALDYGKHVLSEKPMSLTGDEAWNVHKIAQTNGLVLMEAIKTAYCPGFIKTLALAKQGAVGKVRLVESCFTKLENTDNRELTDKKYGGSMTELGSYVILPMIKLLGTDIEKWNVKYDSIKALNGLDLMTRISVAKPSESNINDSEMIATGTCGLGVKSEGRLVIAGTTGYILVSAPWWKTTRIEVHYEDPNQVDFYKMEFAGDGLRYELKEFARACNGQEYYVGWSPEESIAAAKLMEEFLQGR